MEAFLSNSTSIIGSSSMANSGKNLILSKQISIAAPKPSENKDPHISWILDSRATDHVAPIKKLFISYVPCSNYKEV